MKNKLRINEKSNQKKLILLIFTTVESKELLFSVLISEYKFL